MAWAFSISPVFSCLHPNEKKQSEFHLHEPQAATKPYEISHSGPRAICSKNLFAVLEYGVEHHTHLDKYVAHFSMALAGPALNFEIDFEGNEILANWEIDTLNTAKRGARAEANVPSPGAAVRRSVRWFDRERLPANTRSFRVSKDFAAGHICLRKCWASKKCPHSAREYGRTQIL